MSRFEGIKNLSKTDLVTYVLAALLLVTLGLASLYGFKYGRVDESTAAGTITICDEEGTWLKATIDEELNADVECFGKHFLGTFRLAGAEEDSVLYQLGKVKYSNGQDADGVILFLRMPRSGLQGDFQGPWMVYFSWANYSIQHSFWVLTNEDGTAFAGMADGMNAVTTQRPRLIELASAMYWQKDGNVLSLSTEAPEA